MKKFILFFVLLAILAISLVGCAETKPPAPVTKIKVALLPIIDTLPMYVAEQKGLFAENNVEVEFIPVASAPERNQLIASGQADGVINETINVMTFNAEKPTVQVVSYALRPAPGYPHFFILASGESGITTVDQLKGVEIGVSEGTVIEYVTERILTDNGLAPLEIKMISVPKIPDRMALLASGELKAGTMPDPLAALSVQQGSKIVIADANYPQYGFSVISFRKEVIDQNPEAIRRFLKAVAAAVEMINANPKDFTDLLSAKKLVPDPLLESYKVPLFPAPGVPTEEEWNDALSWATRKGMLESQPSYVDGVNPSFLPVP